MMCKKTAQNSRPVGVIKFALDALLSKVSLPNTLILNTSIVYGVFPVKFPIVNDLD